MTVSILSIFVNNTISEIYHCKTNLDVNSLSTDWLIFFYSKQYTYVHLSEH